MAQNESLLWGKLGKTPGLADNRAMVVVRILVSLSVLVLFSAVPAFATSTPGTLTYQGRIIKPDTTPLEAAAVTFTVQVRSPDANNCLLYEDTQVGVNMTGSNGIFSLELGVPGNRTDGQPYTFRQVFDNTFDFPAALTCDVSNDYVPSATDGRNLVITFNDGGGPVTLSPAHEIRSVPFALVADVAQSAKAVGSIQASNVASLRDDVTHDLNQSNLEAIFTTANYTELLALLAGTSSSFVNATPTSAVDFNSQRLTSVADPTSAQDAATKNYTDSNIGGTSANITGVSGAAGDGKVLSWNQGAGEWQAVDLPAGDIVNTPAGSIAATDVQSAINELDSEKLALAGGTMSGDIDMNGNNTVNTGYITMNADTYLHLGRYDDTAENALVTTPLTAAHEGVMWYDEEDDILEYWDGNVVQTVGNGATPATTADADDDTKIQVEESTDEDTIRFDTAGAERMVIDSSGNVGIGTASMDQALHLKGRMVFEEPGGGSKKWVAFSPSTSNDFVIAEDTAAGSQRFVIEAGGNVGIGTTSPASQMHVVDSTSNTPITAERDGGKLRLALYNYSDTPSDDGQIVMIKSRGSQASPTGVQTEDELGAVVFGGRNPSGGALHSAAVIQSFADAEFGTSSDTTDGPGRLEFQTAPDGDNVPLTRMTIKSDGNVGINTTTPGSKLHVSAGELTLDGTGAYLNYQPNNVECGNNEVLKWDATNDRWLCGTDNAGAGAQTMDGTYDQGGNTVAVDTASMIWNLSGGNNFQVSGGELILDGTGAYLDYKPNNTACADGEVLKWVTANDRWECGTDTGGVAATRNLTAGAGLTGGGDLSADRTFDVGAGQGISVGANDVSVDINGQTGITPVLADELLIADASDANNIRKVSLTDLQTLIDTTVADTDTQNTLDGAYDEGGAGAGRAITVDTGAVQFTGSNAADETLEVTQSGNGGAMLIENTGTGASFRVNDEAADTSPFVITESGQIGIGTASPERLLHLGGGTAAADILLDKTVANANDGHIEFRKSRGTAGSETIVQDGDNLGSLIFYAYDGASYQPSAQIQAITNGTPGANDTPGALRFMTTPDGSSGSSERMRVSASGNVGVGTTNPGSLLHVNGGIQISDTDMPNAADCDAAGEAGRFRYSGGSMQFCNGSSWQTLGVSGAGLTSLGGQTGNTQTFATSVVSGTDTGPNISSGSDTHTLNIPLASDAATTVGGLLTNAEYDGLVQVSGDTMTGDLAMGSNKVTGLAAPTAGGDAANKTYVDGNLLGTTLAAPGAPQVSQSIRWNAGGTAWEYYTPATGDVSSTRNLTAGAGLTGGGDLSADRTFDVGAGDGINVNADDIEVDINGLTAETTPDGANDLVMIYDQSNTALRKMTINNLTSLVGGNQTLDQVYDQGGNTVTVDSDDVIFNLSSTQDFFVQDNGNPAFTVMDNGNVGVGLVTPGQKFSIKQASDASDAGLGIINAATTSAAKLWMNGIDLSMQINSNDNQLVLDSTGSVALGTITPSPSAVLQVDSTTQGFLPPRMTTAQRTGIGSPAEGLIVFDTNEDALYVYQNSAWAKLANTTEVAFSVNRNSVNQSIPNNTTTIVDFTTEDFDTDNAFNTGTNRFQPTKAGHYYFKASASFDNLSANRVTAVYIYKNGTYVSRDAGYSPNYVSDFSMATSVVLYMNGTTDYVDMRVYHNHGSALNLFGTIRHTNFGGFLISGGTGGGGGGADHLGNHTASQNIILGSHYLSGDGDPEGIQIDASGNVSLAQNLTLTGNVDMSGATIADNSISLDDLDFGSAAGGLNIPQLAADPGSATEGQLYYNTVSDVLKVYANGAWVEVGSGGAAPTGTVFGTPSTSYSFATTYTAPSDGIVTASARASVSNCQIDGNVNSSLVAKDQALSASGKAGVTFPVKAGDDWEIGFGGSGCDQRTVQFMPIVGPGSGTLTDLDGDTKIEVEESADEDIIRFDTGGTERMQIAANGFVGIGTNNPDEKLSVDGDSWASVRSRVFSNSDYAGLILSRARGTQAGALTVADNDTVGTLVARGYNGTGWGEHARIDFEVDGATIGVGDAPGRIVLKTAPDGTAVPLSRMTIRQDGNVGIGTSTPDKLFSVSGASTDTFVQIDNTATNGNAWNLISSGNGSGNPAGSFGIQDQDAGSTRFLIDENGLVGIGLVDPLWGQLEIETAAVPLAFRETGRAVDDGGMWRIPVDNGEFRWDRNTAAAGDFSAFSSPLVMQPDGDVILAQTDGRVGIGTDPGVKFHVVSNDGANTGYYVISNQSITNNAGGTEFTRFYTGQISDNLGFIEVADETNTKGDLAIQPWGGNVSIGYGAAQTEKLEVNGNVKAAMFVSSSDRNLKRDIATLDSSLDKIKQLRGVTYFWRGDEYPERNFTPAKQYGVIAQEVEEVFPELVLGEEGDKSVHYTGLISPLIEATKEVADMCEMSERKIASLEERMAEKDRQIEKLQKENEELKKKVDWILQELRK